MEISTEFYILYGYLAFMSAIMIVLTVAAIRLCIVLDRQSAELADVDERLARLEVKIDEITKFIKASIESTQRQAGTPTDWHWANRVYIAPDETPAD